MKKEYLIYGLIAIVIGFLAYKMSQKKTSENATPNPNPNPEPLATANSVDSRIKIGETPQIPDLMSAANPVSTGTGLSIPQAPEIPKFNGTYRMVMAHSNLSVWADNIIRQHSYLPNDAHHYIITSRGDGYYSILVKANYNAWTAKSGKTEVFQEKFTNKPEQLWKITATPDGFYQISNKSQETDYVLSIRQNSKSNGAVLESGFNVDAPRQKMSILKMV